LKESTSTSMWFSYLLAHAERVASANVR